MASPSQVIEVRHSSSVSALDELDSILKGEKAAEMVVTDPEQINREIVAQLLAAETDEDLAIQKATPWQELAGVPIEIHSFTFRPSSYEEGAPVFVVVHGMNMANGERVVLTTGGYNILAQLSNLARRERFPSIWKLEISENATSRGFHPLWLVKATKEEEDLARSMADPSNPLDED